MGTKKDDFDRLDDAFKVDRIAGVRKVVARGIPIDSPLGGKEGGLLPVAHWIDMGFLRTEELEELLELGTDPNRVMRPYPALPHLTRTLLHHVLRRWMEARIFKYREWERRGEKMFELLLEAGADPRAGTLSLYSYPAMAGAVDVIERLHQLGADPEAEDVIEGYISVPLAFAANLKTAKLLKQIGVPVNHVDMFGRKPLQVALVRLVRPKKRDLPLPLLKWFIKEGNDPFHRTEAGAGSLHYAALGGSAKAVRYLVEEVGMDPNDRDGTGDTPLHWAAGHWELGSSIPHGGEVVDALVELGADIEARNDEGLTPLMVALLKKGHPRVIERLVEMGADLHARDPEGRDVLTILEESDRPPAFIEDVEKIFRRKLAERGELEIEVEPPESISDLASLAQEFLEQYGEHGVPTERVYVLYPMVGVPDVGHVMKIGGKPVGVDKESWPKARRDVYRVLDEDVGLEQEYLSLRPHSPMEHVLTLDLSRLARVPEGLENVAAYALFVPHAGAGVATHLVEEGDFTEEDFYAIRRLSTEDVSRGVIYPNKAPAYTGIEPTPIGVVEVTVPSWIFYALPSTDDLYDMEREKGRVDKAREKFLELMGEMPEGVVDPGEYAHFVEVLKGFGSKSALFEFLSALANLREMLFDFSYMGGRPIFIQNTEEDYPTLARKFLAQFGDDLISDYGEDAVGFFNFGDAGRVYLFSDRVLAQGF